MKNWTTTITAIGSQLSTILLAISLIPYSLPTDLSTVLPPKVKAWIFTSALVAKTILSLANITAQHLAQQNQPQQQQQNKNP